MAWQPPPQYPQGPPQPPYQQQPPGWGPQQPQWQAPAPQPPRRQKVPRWQVVVAVLVLVLGVVMAAAIDKKGSAHKEGAAATEVTATDLLSAYEDNEVAADKKYKGRWVKITGIVGDIKKGVLGKVYVTIGTGERFELPIVQCFAAKRMSDDAASLKRGQKITAKGRVEGLMMNVVVRECTF